MLDPEFPVLSCCSTTVCFTLLRPMRWSALGRHLHCSRSDFILWLKVYSPSQGELAYMDRNPCPWPLTGSSACRWGLQILTVWLVHRDCPDWSQKSCSDWLELHISKWMGKVSILLVEIGFQEAFIRAAQMAEAQFRPVIQYRRFPEMQFVWEAPV